MSKVEKEEIPRVRRRLAEVQRLQQEMAAHGGEVSDRFAQAMAAEREVTALLREHELRLLEIGAAGRLPVTGEIDAVLTLGDADLPAAAKPVRPDGTVRPVTGKVQARADAQVRAVRKHGSSG